MKKYIVEMRGECVPEYKEAAAALMISSSACMPPKSEVSPSSVSPLDDAEERYVETMEGRASLLSYIAPMNMRWKGGDQD